MNKKSCLFFMPILFTGGSEKQIRMIVDGLCKRKYVVTVVVESSSEDIHKDEQIFINQHPNVKFIFANTFNVDVKSKFVLKKYFTKILSLLKLAKILIRVISKYNVNIAMITNLTGLSLFPVFKLCGCKIVYNERNPGQTITNAFWKRFLLQKCDRIVCNSKNASKIMEARLNKVVPVINNGVEEKMIKKEKTLEMYNILIPARISKIKNQIVVLRAIRQLPPIKVKVFFAGAKEDTTYFDTLMNMVKKYDLDNKVEFLGFLSNIDNYYQKADVVILPSFEEGTPNVLLESFMRKIICLASNIPMNNDCMLQKEFLFNPNSPEDLAKKIMYVYEMTKKCQVFVTEFNYKFVCENYSVSKMIDSYDELFRNL